MLRRSRQEVKITKEDRGYVVLCVGPKKMRIHVDSLSAICYHIDKRSHEQKLKENKNVAISV